jgi:uncharacterized protein YbjT (DUF2867 family)
MILVTGATGNNGSELVRELSARGVASRAFVRNRERAQVIAHPCVEIREADFDYPETITPILEGVDRLFLLIPSSENVEEQQLQFVDAAKRSGVKHIVKLSQFGASLNSPGRFQRYHAVVEDYIRESGLTYTFLRPNLFMQGLLNFRSTIARRGIFFASAGNARVSAVDVRDIAAVAAQVLTEDGHEDETYELIGPEALSHSEMASLLSSATGMTIKYVDVPLDALRQFLVDLGIPKWQAEGLVEEYAIYRCGGAAQVTDTVFEVTGTAPRSFSEFAWNYSETFRSRSSRVA